MHTKVSAHSSKSGWVWLLLLLVVLLQLNLNRNLFWQIVRRLHTRVQMMCKFIENWNERSSHLIHGLNPENWQSQLANEQIGCQLMCLYSIKRTVGYSSKTRHTNKTNNIPSKGKGTQWLALALSLFFHNSIFGCELPISTIQTACDFTKAKIIFLSKSVPAAINLNCLMFCFIFESHYKRKRVRRKSDFRPKIIFTVNAMHRNQLPPSFSLSLSPPVSQCILNHVLTTAHTWTQTITQFTWMWKESFPCKILFVMNFEM